MSIFQVIKSLKKKKKVRYIFSIVVSITLVREFLMFFKQIFEIVCAREILESATKRKKILQKFVRDTKWSSLAKRYIWIKLIFFKGMHHFPPSRPPMNLISPFIPR